MDTQAQTKAVDLGGVFLEALLGGNPIAIILTLFAAGVAFLWAGNKYFPDLLHRLLRRAGSRKYVNTEAQERRLLVDMHSKIDSCSNAFYASDPGRQKLYRHIVVGWSSALLEALATSYDEVQKSKNWREWKSYAFHSALIAAARAKFNAALEEAMSREGWDDSKRRYTHEALNSFFSPTADSLLNDLAWADASPYLIMAFYRSAFERIYGMAANRLTSAINGELTGLPWDGSTIGENK
jgi:hypothetical protein